MTKAEDTIQGKGQAFVEKIEGEYTREASGSALKLLKQIFTDEFGITL